MTKMGGLAIATQLALNKVFALQPRLEQAILFGSRAKGNYRNGSDIDLVLVGDELSIQDLLALELAIDELLLPYRVDMVLKHHIDNPDLLAHIERVGLPFYRRDPHASTHEIVVALQS